MIFLLFFLTDFNSVILCIFHIFLIHEKNPKSSMIFISIKRVTDSTMSTTSEQTDTTSRQASTTSGHTSGKTSTTSGQTSTTSG